MAAKFTESINRRHSNAVTFAGVAWGFGKHDSAWKECPIFGKTRYMNAAGLKRKCNIKWYVEKVSRIIGVVASVI